MTTDDGLGADTFVNAGTHADRNFGGRADMLVKNGGASVARKIYLRFDLPQFSFDGPLTEAAYRPRSPPGPTISPGSKTLTAHRASRWSRRDLTGISRPSTGR